MVTADEVIYTLGYLHPVGDGDHHCAISSGAQVSAIDAETGEELWTVRLQALGPIDHSRYINETQIEIDARGLVIYGNETQGTYVEVFDPQTGVQLDHGNPDHRFVALEWEGNGPGDPQDQREGSSELAMGDTHFVVTVDEDPRAPTTLARIDGHEMVWTTAVPSVTRSTTTQSSWTRCTGMYSCAVVKLPVTPSKWSTLMRACRRCCSRFGTEGSF